VYGKITPMGKKTDILGRIQFFRNIKSTGNLTWSGQVFGVISNNSKPDVATGTGWANITITLSPDGQTMNRSDGFVYTRDPDSK
jgi:hypothetical protein